jgi:hypothetical protein
LGQVAGEHCHEERREQAADEGAVTIEYCQACAKHDLDAARRHHHAVRIHGDELGYLRLEGLARPEQVADACDDHRASQRQPGSGTRGRRRWWRQRGSAAHTQLPSIRPVGAPPARLPDYRFCASGQ